jgi:hypothetical protein
MRRYLEARDGRTCGRCGDPIDRTETASLGHVTARAHGGSDSSANLRLEHLVCNQRAGADRDRAREIELGDVGAIFYRARIAPAEPPPRGMVPGIGPGSRTFVRFREDPRR